MSINNSLWDGSIERKRGREVSACAWGLPPLQCSYTSMSNLTTSSVPKQRRRERSQLLGFSHFDWSTLLLHTSRYNWRVNASNILLYTLLLLLLPSFCPIHSDDRRRWRVWATSTSATTLLERGSFFIQDIILDDPKLRSHFNPYIAREIRPGRPSFIVTSTTHRPQ